MTTKQLPLDTARVVQTRGDVQGVPVPEVRRRPTDVTLGDVLGDIVFSHVRGALRPRQGTLRARSMRK